MSVFIAYKVAAKLAFYGTSQDHMFSIDLGVAAVRLGRFKSSCFSSMSPPKFSTQVAAEFQDKSHDLWSKYSVNLQ